MGSRSQTEKRVLFHSKRLFYMAPQDADASSSPLNSSSFPLPFDHYCPPIDEASEEHKEIKRLQGILREREQIRLKHFHSSSSSSFPWSSSFSSSVSSFFSSFPLDVDLSSHPLITSYTSLHPSFLSLSTLPSRMCYLHYTLETLNISAVSGILINLPLVNERGERNAYPYNPHLLQFDHMIKYIVHPVDYGPMTKYVGSSSFIKYIFEDPLSILIAVDDDAGYVPSFVPLTLLALIHTAAATHSTAIVVGHHGQNADYWGFPFFLKDVNPFFNHYSRPSLSRVPLLLPLPLPLPPSPPLPSVPCSECNQNDGIRVECCEILEGFAGIGTVVGNIYESLLIPFTSSQFDKQLRCFYSDDLVSNWVWGGMSVNRIRISTVPSVPSLVHYPHNADPWALSLGRGIPHEEGEEASDINARKYRECYALLQAYAQHNIHSRRRDPLTRSLSPSSSLSYSLSLSPSPSSSPSLPSSPPVNSPSNTTMNELIEIHGAERLFNLLGGFRLDLITIEGEMKEMTSLCKYIDDPRRDQWIYDLFHGHICGEIYEGSNHGMNQEYRHQTSSARSQCFHYCLFNLYSSAIEGWEYKEREHCWVRFKAEENNTNQCVMQHLKEREETIDKIKTGHL
jgi:hypothetical protein